MRIAKLLLASTLLMILFAPSLAMATEVWDNIRNAEQELESAVESFKLAKQKGHFKSRGEADKVRAKLELATTLLKRAKIKAHRSRPFQANQKVETVQGLIEETNELSTVVDQSGLGSSGTDAADETSYNVFPGPVSDGPTLILAPSSD